MLIDYLTRTLLFFFVVKFTRIKKKFKQTKVFKIILSNILFEL